MATGYGLARAMSGVPQALREDEARRDRQASRLRRQELEGREDIEFAQRQEERQRRHRREDVSAEREKERFGQEKVGWERTGTEFERKKQRWGQEDVDRATRLRREQKQEKRDDTEWNRATEKYDRHMAMTKAIQDWQLNGNIQAVADFASKYDPSGNKHVARRLDDGNYEVKTTTPDGKVQQNIMTPDEIGKYVNMLSIADPITYTQQQQAGAAEHARAVELERVKGEERRKTDAAKPGKTGDMTKQQNALADDGSNVVNGHFGSKFQDGFSFDKPNAAMKATVGNAIVEDAIRVGGAENGRLAGQKAVSTVLEIENAAKDYAKNLGLSRDETETYVDSALQQWAEQNLGAGALESGRSRLETKTGSTPATELKREPAKKPTGDQQKESGFFRTAGASEKKEGAKPFTQKEKPATKLERQAEKPKEKPAEKAPEKQLKLGKTLERGREQSLKDKRAKARKVIAKYKSRKPRNKNERLELKRARKILEGKGNQ